MALTRKGKFGALILVLAVLGTAFYFASSHGLIGRKDAPVDIAAPAQPAETPTQPPVHTPQEAQEAPTPAPVAQSAQEAPQANLQPSSASSDTSSNKGVQFLLNQGKSQ